MEQNETSPVDVAQEKILDLVMFEEGLDKLRDILTELYDAAQRDERAAVENRLDAAYQRERIQMTRKEALQIRDAILRSVASNERAQREADDD